MAITVLAAPGAASAASKAPTVSPPGNSGLTQYLEVVPTASGGKPSKNVKNDKTPLSTSQQQRLQRAGSDGQTLLKVVSGTSPEATTPTKPKAKHRHKPKKKATTTTTLPTTTTSSHKKGVLATAFGTGGGGSGDGGLGIPLAIPMLVAAALAGGFALGRRRGAMRDDSAEPLA